MPQQDTRAQTVSFLSFLVAIVTRVSLPGNRDSFETHAMAGPSLSSSANTDRPPVPGIDGATPIAQQVGLTYVSSPSSAHHPYPACSLPLHHTIPKMVASLRSGHRMLPMSVQSLICSDPLPSHSSVLTQADFSVSKSTPSKSLRHQADVSDLNRELLEQRPVSVFFHIRLQPGIRQYISRNRVARLPV